MGNAGMVGIGSVLSAENSASKFKDVGITPMERTLDTNGVPIMGNSGEDEEGAPGVLLVA